MQLGNIDRILCFAEPDGTVLTLGQLQAKYGFEPDGTNFYYGINSINATQFADSGEALNGFSHRPFFDGMLDALNASQADEKTVNLGVEPNELTDPYGFVSGNLKLVQKLAQELNDYQQRALSNGKRLNIVVRYASEMNDANVYGHQPAAYVNSFQTVRNVFRQQAPDILFAYSPAIRSDLFAAMSSLSAYWPGDDFVDVISCTWYIGAATQAADSMAFCKSYFLQRAMKNKAFGIDELGGSDATGHNNDAVLQQMLHVLEGLQLQNVSFKYATIFLQNKWGTDATLSFLKAPAQGL